ncbi:hypothetical protein KCP77_07765 [Salmonella enterica subsp. enterica]|nr:hypothetical protein KCP77_07765 [Salmonella enterica subsp. enterica]
MKPHGVGLNHHLCSLFTAVSAFIRIIPSGRWSGRHGDAHFRSHKLKISTFFQNAYEITALFNYCDQKQQIFNNAKGEVNGATSLTTASMRK